MNSRLKLASLIVLLVGCGTPGGVIPSPGAQPARKLEGPRVSVVAGSFKSTFYYGPWQCNRRWWAYCERQCAAEGRTLKGCMWLADLKLDWEGLLYVKSGGRYAITHCCCDYPTLTPEANEAQRKKWENFRKSFREDWGKKFGNWPTEGGRAWPGHHIRDLKHGGDPKDPNNILPYPPELHEVLNDEYPACYDGRDPWDKIGPDLPYTD